MVQAFQCIKDNDSIDDKKVYLHEAQDGIRKYNTKNLGSYDCGFIDIQGGNKKKTAAALGAVVLVSITIDAQHESLQFYLPGVCCIIECGSHRLEHCMLTAGYGAD